MIHRKETYWNVKLSLSFSHLGDTLLDDESTLYVICFLQYMMLITNTWWMPYGLWLQLGGNPPNNLKDQEKWSANVPINWISRYSGWHFTNVWNISLLDLEFGGSLFENISCYVPEWLKHVWRVLRDKIGVKQSIHDLKLVNGVSANKFHPYTFMLWTTNWLNVKETAYLEYKFTGTSYNTEQYKIIKIFLIPNQSLYVMMSNAVVTCRITNTVFEVVYLLKMCFLYIKTHIDVVLHLIFSKY